VTRDERLEFIKILQAHAQTIAICEACAATTRDLAAEVGRGSVPAKADLIQTVNQAEQVLKDLTNVREEVERLIAGFR
jgi:sulfur relay (sulfurtransferase) complex TusBCD TusD component (DsrE family)